MLVSGTVGTGSPLREITSLGMNGIKALERSRLPMPTNVSEHNSAHLALADTAVKELLSIISCLSSSLLLHDPFLKSICNNFRIVNKQSHFKREKTVHNPLPFPGKILTST